jgi:hypothetical protein
MADTCLRSRVWYAVWVRVSPAGEFCPAGTVEEGWGMIELCRSVRGQASSDDNNNSNRSSSSSSSSSSSR